MNQWWIGMLNVLLFLMLVISPIAVLAYVRLARREEQVVKAAFRRHRRHPLGRPRGFHA